MTALDAPRFRSKLMRWYRESARVLPWRGVDDPYKIWVSEIMLQQTRVQAVMEHYRRFLKLYPTVQALAKASEQQVLAAWSGLGYYRRARMMHAAAKVVVAEHGGRLSGSSAELRGLPGIGEYTAAAIASIAYGERVAVVDGNVERVLLRVTGRAEDKTAAGKRFVAAQAAALVGAISESESGIRKSGAAAKRSAVRVAPAEHNQAMMELGAIVCLPRGPLCGECPVYELCRTRGEHATAVRMKPQRREVAYLLAWRIRGKRAEVLLVQRASNEMKMAGMWELPMLSPEVLAPHEPVLAVKHSITNTNYDVRVYAGAELQREVDAAGQQWVRADALQGVALTGLARKILRKMDVMKDRE